MGLQWDGDIYIDVGVTFGFKMGAAGCHMCTDAITLMLNKCHIWLRNYLDDYIGVATESQAESHFLSLSNILNYVGLPINQKKVETPSNIINCLGISINAKTGVLKIAEKK